MAVLWLHGKVARVKLSRPNHLACQKVTQLLQLLLVCPVGVRFPGPNQQGDNSHFLRELTKCNFFLIPLDLNQVAQCFYACR